MHFNLIIKYLSGNLSKDEEKILFDWINSNPKNNLFFKQIKLIWEKSAQLKPFDHIKSLSDWEKIKPNFRKKYSIRSEKISGIRYIGRIAAILVLALGLTFGLIKITHIASKPEVVTLNTQDNIKLIQLPDGSQLTLNKNSYISYTSDFNRKNRKIELEGEAYFEVMPNNSLPFLILVKNSTIQVIGTKFSIREDTSSVKVTVISGKLLFYETGNHSNRVELKRDETASFERYSKRIVYGTNIDNNFLSWKTGKFVFSKTPTLDVLSTIAEHFDKKLIIQVALKDSITGVFDNQPLNEILNEIEMTSSLKIDNYDDYIVVKKY